MVNEAWKPKPDVYFYAAKQIDIDPSRCIAIEDSASGIKAAKAAGMDCVGINTGGNPKFTQEADIQIDTFDEINLEKILY
ncbi:MAG TPA: HAD family phosphatase [Candidatus Babeliales bacterium]|nr:HAD family phosphatase [Candidatus Babeliales bacterium]